jgi:tape measure domain-containing protein
MATSNRDVRLGVEIETTGEEGIRRLAQDVRLLAKEGGDAAPEFAALAAQLDKLAAQASAATALKSLNAELNKLSAEQREAAAAADAASAKYIEQKAATDQLRTANAGARESVNGVRVALAQARAELTNFTAGQTADAKKTATYRDEVVRLTAAVGDQRVNLASKTAELNRSRAALNEAEQAEGKLAAQSTALATAAGKTAAALRERTSALTQAQAAALAAGVDTERLAEAERDVADAARLAVDQVNRLGQEQRDLAVAAQQAAAGLAEGERAMRALEKASAQAESELQQFQRAEVAAAESARQAAIAADRQAAARVEQADADRLAALSARGLAEAQERGRLAAESELAAIRESELFMQRYAAAKAEGVKSTNAFIAATQRSGETLEKAFGATGIRSLNAIETEIQSVERAMSLLERRTKLGTLSQEEFSRATGAAAVRLAVLKREMATVPNLAGPFEALSGKVNNLITRFGALSAAVATVGFAVKPVIEATVALDQMRRVLTTVSGSAEAAEEQIDFLRKTAQASGQQFDLIGASYAKFAASALQSGLSLEDTQKVFESVTLAAGNLGLSSDQAKRALEALSQIASKGVVSMEELRQQLGDALPGVLPLLAKQLGLTQAELNKVVESGQLLASEAIPAIGIALTELGPKAGVVNGIVATFNRFINTVKEAGTTIVEGPLGGAATVVLNAFAGVLRDISFIAVSASEGIKFLGTVVATVGGIFTGEIKSVEAFGAALDKAAQEGATRIEQFKRTAYGAAEGTTELARAAEAGGASFAKLALELQAGVDQAELSTRVADKLAQAVEAQANSVTKNIGALEDERTALGLQAEAAEKVAQAREAVAVASEAEAKALRDAIADSTAYQIAQEGSTEKIKLYLEQQNKKLQTADADVEKTRAQAKAAREAATAAGLAAEKFGDQSKALGQLRKDVDAAQRAYDSIVRRFKAGKADTDDLAKASSALAEAKNKLRDAINDLSEALERELGLLRSEFALKEAALKLELEELKNAERKALLAGNEFAASQAAIRQKEIELALSRTGIELKGKEIQLQLDAVNAEEAALRSSGQLTAEKKIELQTRRNNLEAQKLENKATEEGTKATAEEVQALKRGVTARGEHSGAVDKNSKSLTGNTGEVTKNSAALDENAKKAAEAAAAAERYTNQLAGSATNSSITGVRSVGEGAGPSVLGPSKIGPTGSSDFTGSYNVPTPSGYYYTLDPYDPNIERSAGYDPLGRPYPGFFAKNPTTPGTGRSGSTGSTVGAFGGYAGSEAQRAGIPDPTVVIRPPSVAPTPGVTMNVTIGGVERTITAPTQADADAILKALEDAFRAGGGG